MYAFAIDNNTISTININCQIIYINEIFAKKKYFDASKFDDCTCVDFKDNTEVDIKNIKIMVNFTS